MNEFSPFGPVVEKSAKDAFIDRSPIEIISSGDAHDLPWITGVVSEEGLYPVAGTKYLVKLNITFIIPVSNICLEFARNKAMLKDLDENWESIAPHLLQYYFTIPLERHAGVAQKIRKHYFNNKSIDRENLLVLTHMVGDRIFSADAAKAAKVQAKANQSPVWFYYYNYRAKNSLSDAMSNSTENFGLYILTNNWLEHFLFHKITYSIIFYRCESW